jgi:Glycosyltransferase family 87
MGRRVAAADGWGQATAPWLGGAGAAERPEGLSRFVERLRSTDPATLRRRALRDGLVLAGLFFAAYLFVVVAPRVRTFGFDAYAYWTVDPAHPYVGSIGHLGWFAYSPALAQVASLFSALPWLTFLWLWTAVQVGTLIWLGRRRVLWLLAFPPVALELYHGNVNLLIAAAVVLGFRYPAAWAFILLTKVTPGIGLLWFAVRREWRQLAIALGATAAIAAVSFVAAPSLWAEWLGAIVANAGTVPSPAIAIPLWIRLPLAVVVVIWAAHTDRRWALPVAVMLAMPALWYAVPAILAASVPLANPGAQWRLSGPWRVAAASAPASSRAG